MYMLIAPILLSTFLQRQRVDATLPRQLIKIGRGSGSRQLEPSVSEVIGELR